MRRGAERIIIIIREHRSTYRTT
nr:hypothetical protein [Rickettsia asembonensis]